MNNPEYILPDEFEYITEATRVALGLISLNYQSCDIYELNETLIQMSQLEQNYLKKFPLVWFEQPFRIQRGFQGFFGRLNNGRIFIINSADKTSKAKRTLNDKFKPIIYPIYREILRQIDLSLCFSTISVEDIPHTYTGFNYWGEEQKSVLQDAVDCLEISGLQLVINNNQNCTTFKNF